MKKFNYNTDIKGWNKLTKDQQFFVSNFIEFEETMYTDNYKCIDIMLKQQRIDAKELLSIISNIMLDYNIADNNMVLSTRDRIRLNNELKNKIAKIFNGQTKLENNTITTILLDLAKDKYYSNSYLLTLGMNFNLKKISDEKLDKILKKKIDGLTYSDRIWKNKDEVARQLQNDIKQFLNGEINCNNIKKTIQSRFNVTKNDAKRMVRNELCIVQNDVNEVWFEDNEVEYLLYSATLDNRTCDDCAKYDGITYRKDDSNRPELPRHPNDRCTYIALPHKDYRPTKRIDNITKEHIEWKDYKIWRQENDSKL